MAKPASLALDRGSRALYWAEQAAIVVSASLFVALCAHVTVPLPFTPVPLTLQNFGVLLVGLTLGSRRGFAALALYLVEGASGMPVFNPAGLGGIAQLVRCDRGFLLAYPFVAVAGGWIMERGKASFARAATAGVLAEVVLFARRPFLADGF
jgi:biotin transport system substrate-specific component